MLKILAHLQVVKLHLKNVHEDFLLVWPGQSETLTFKLLAENYDLKKKEKVRMEKKVKKKKKTFTHRQLQMKIDLIGGTINKK